MHTAFYRMILLAKFLWEKYDEYAIAFVVLITKTVKLPSITGKIKPILEAFFSVYC